MATVGEGGKSGRAGPAHTGSGAAGDPYGYGTPGRPVKRACRGEGLNGWSGGRAPLPEGR